MLCRIGGSVLGSGGVRSLASCHRRFYLVLGVLILLVLVGDGAEGRGQRGRVHGAARLGGPEDLLNGLISLLERHTVAVLGAEELLREGHRVRSQTLEGRRGPRHDTRGLNLVKLLDESVVGLLRLTKQSLELLIPDLQCLDLESLSLSGRLGGPTIPEHTLDSALLLLVFGLGTFPDNPPS